MSGRGIPYQKYDIDKLKKELLNHFPNPISLWGYPESLIHKTCGEMIDEGIVQENHWDLYNQGLSG
jgi:hypothetical protein